MRIRADEVQRLDVRQQRRDRITRSADRPRARSPFAVLHTAVVFATRAGSGRQDGAIVAEPADALERPARRGLHLLDPFAHLLDRRRRLGWHDVLGQDGRTHPQYNVENETWQ